MFCHINSHKNNFFYCCNGLIRGVYSSVCAGKKPWKFFKAISSPVVFQTVGIFFIMVFKREVLLIEIVNGNSGIFSISFSKRCSRPSATRLHLKNYQTYIHFI